MKVIPLSRIPNQTFSVVLDGQDCAISLYWRQERLYLDLVCGGLEVACGAICENRANILQSRQLNFKGSLHFFDGEGDRPPHYDGLDNRWVLIFVPEDENLPEKLRY